MNVVDTKSISAKTGPVFAHSKVGKNLDPLSKINEFSSIVEKDIGNKADIAFFKFCYVDFPAHGEVETIFQHYRETLSRLREAYPGTTLIHFTTPLVRREKGLKTVIKQFLGRDRTGYEDNLVRHRFNELLRNEYVNREPFFDLALLESTHSNGKTQYYSEGSQKYYSLYDGYTTDGGHLNAKGSRFIAEQLLAYLAGVLGKNQ